jgi:hypothetical protein
VSAAAAIEDLPRDVARMLAVEILLAPVRAPSVRGARFASCPHYEQCAPSLAGDGPPTRKTLRSQAKPRVRSESRVWDLLSNRCAPDECDGPSGPGPSSAARRGILSGSS